MKQAGIVLGFLALGACSSVPSVPNLAGQPEAIFPVAPDAPEVWAASGVAGEMPNSDWLSQFNDEKLIDLVNEALSANPSIRSQFYAVEATRAQARSAYGRTLPNLSASASAGGTSNYIELIDSRTDDPTFGVGLDLSWDIDLWGAYELVSMLPKRISSPVKPILPPRVWRLPLKQRLLGSI